MKFNQLLQSAFAGTDCVLLPLQVQSKCIEHLQEKWFVFLLKPFLSFFFPIIIFLYIFWNLSREAGRNSVWNWFNCWILQPRSCYSWWFGGWRPGINGYILSTIITVVDLNKVTFYIFGWDPLTIEIIWLSKFSQISPNNLDNQNML